MKEMFPNHDESELKQALELAESLEEAINNVVEEDSISVNNMYGSLIREECNADVNASHDMAQSVFRHNISAFNRWKYYAFGQLTAIGLLQGSPGPQCFSKSVFATVPLRNNLTVRSRSICVRNASEKNSGTCSSISLKTTFSHRKIPSPDET